MRRILAIHVPVGFGVESVGDTRGNQHHPVAAASANAGRARMMAGSVPPDASAEFPLITCPLCSRKFRRRRAIVRRSSAECPSCKQKIWIDPFQRLYPGQVCLSEEQAQYVVFLMRLTDMWCGVDLMKHLDAVRTAMRDGAGTAPSAAQILHRLLTTARGRCVDRDEEQALRELIRDFKAFQRALRRPGPAVWSSVPLRRLLRIPKSP